MKVFPPGRVGATIGTREPWVEAIAQHYGTLNITIIEYQRITSVVPGITSSPPVAALFELRL